jgi:hypothetical protein
MTPRSLIFPLMLATVFVITAAPFATGARKDVPGQQPPVNQSPPSVSGTPIVGATLTADPGTWSGPGVKFDFQWQRCDAGGNGCTDISGARSSSYLVAAADVGLRLRILVTATNKNGSASAASAASATVAAAPVSAPTVVPPAPLTPPSISGTPQEGQTLQASSGTWSGTTPLSYRYQWSRCNSTGGSCSAVAGATSTTYSLTANDVGATMVVQVTASNTAGSASAVSAPTSVVAALTSTPIGSTLTWAPPALSSPVTVQVQSNGQACPSLTSPAQDLSQPWVCYLDPTKDYVLKLGHRQEAGKIPGLVVSGGRNVVILGGRVTIPAPADPSPERKGLTFHDQTGIVHVEGVLVDGSPLQCLVLNSAQAVFQIENFRCEGVSMYKENFSTAHSDIILTWKSPPEIRIDKFTSDYDGTGLAFYGQRRSDGSWTYPGKVVLKRTNIRNMTKSACSNFSKPLGHMYVASWRQTRIEVDRMFAETGWGRASTTTDCPNPGSFQFKLADGWATYNGTSDYPKTQRSSGDGLNTGSYFEFTNPTYDNVWGVGGAYARVDYGIPVGGDYVPAGLAGTGYTSPGYTK